MRMRKKSQLRCTRAKQARRTDELTIFAYSEAHSLRILRDKLTGIKWHVDHIIPLKGKLVSGLHVWNNFAVIPKVENLRKGAKHSLHD
jgi:5-methylcytosine-specific restriction endonuclease McrA